MARIPFSLRLLHKFYRVASDHEPCPRRLFDRFSANRFSPHIVAESSLVSLPGRHVGNHIVDIPIFTGDVSVFPAQGPYGKARKPFGPDSLLEGFPFTYRNCRYPLPGLDDGVPGEELRELEKFPVIYGFRPLEKGGQSFEPYVPYIVQLFKDRGRVSVGKP